MRSADAQRSPVEKGQPSPSGSDASTPTIQLPKGGGAIRGIGEKFAANPVTGTGSMSVPIPTSPGRSGFGPQLSLSYDSGAGNGAFGLGWNLSLPSITRKTDKGLPKYRDADESDVFILSGAEDLVPVLRLDAAGNIVSGPNGRPQFVEETRGVYRVRRYRPRIEGLFARIEKWTALDGSHSYWRSISKDNITTSYGKTEESRIADPADSTRIFSWLICESYDDKGNAIRYQYKDEKGVDLSAANERNRSRTAQRYLKRIKYGNKTPHQRHKELSQHLDGDWMFEVVFDYGEHYIESDVTGDDRSQPTIVRIDDAQLEWAIRLDPFSSYRSGFEVRTYRLCQRVLMFHHFAELDHDDYLVRATHFKYQRGPSASFISAVTQSGYLWQAATNTYVKKSLPPVEFEYSAATINETVRDVDADSLENLPYGLDGANYQWVDLDGEGLSGILTEQGGAWFYKRNLGAVPVSAPHVTPPQYAARFAPIERLPTIPSTANLKGGQQLLDLAGDGQLDVVEFDGPTPGFFERTHDEGWETFTAFKSLPNVAWKDPNLKFVDLTGDGHADVFITEDEAFTWYPSLAEAGFGPAEKVRQTFDEEAGPRLVFADGTQSIYLSDLSGDGLTDLVRIRNGEVCYWPNLGYGRFGKKVTMDNAPWFDAPDQFDQKRIRLADIDGSGTVDILYLGRDGVHLYFNNAGNSWAPVRKLNTFPRTDNLSSVTATDLFGNGTACLVWSSPLPGDARRPMRYIDLMGGQKPHLLIKTINNLGAETKVDYTPSTKFYLADKLAGRPWITKLPFPVYCVARVSVADRWRNTEFASTYSYHHGYFDGVEREFRGFGRVEQVDVESYGKFKQGNVASPYITDDHDLYQPPIKTVTWYHTGFALERDRILAAYEQEYFPVPGFAEHKLPQPTLTPTNLTAEEWREAARACKGMMLRQEVFELDVDALERGQQRPVRLFTTAFHNSNIQRLQPRGRNRHAVFLVTESEAITYHYELDLNQGTPDPRIAHTLNLRFDNYGRALQTVAVAYPRQVAFTDPANTLTLPQRELIQEAQRERHLAYTETHYTAELPEDRHQHRLPPPCEVLTYELTGTHATNGFAPSIRRLYFSLDDFRAFALSDTPSAPGKPVAKLDYHQQPANNTAHKRIVEWVRMLYFKDNLSGAEPFGKHAWIGLPYETYKLALTKDLLGAIFGAKLTPAVFTKLDTPSSSGYAPGTALDPSFADQYWIRSGIAGFENDAAQHFYLPERYTDPFDNITTLKYDPRDLFIQSSTDALGNTSGVAIVPPVTGKPRFDYRVLAPMEMVDANDNHTEVVFDILGMVVALAVKGKGSEADNLSGFDDALANPPAAAVQKFCTNPEMNGQTAGTWLRHATARFVYHFGEGRDANGNFIGWAAHRAGACGIVREIHFNAPGGATSPLQVSLECSDGSGNVLMKKVQAEPDSTLPLADQKLRWIINGLTVLNNKGKPVKQYEPAFSADFGCEMPQANGVTPIMYYDAAGRVVRTEMPDGTFSRVEFSPWHVKTFDANDTVLEPECTWYQENGRNRFNRASPLPVTIPGISTPPTPEERAGWLAAQHANTPAQVHLDSRGREVIAIAHNRTPDASGVWRDAFYTTFTKLDAEGKPLWLCDARGNLVMQYIAPAKPNHTPLFDDPNPNWRPAYDMPPNAVPCYDIAGNLLFQHSMDGGDRWMLMDAAGKPMFAWDANDKGANTPQQQRTYSTDYDALHRPTKQWLKINTNPPAVIEAFDYLDTDSFKNAQGIVDEAALANARAKNLIGQAIKHYDPSGLATVERIHLSGKPAHITRTLVKMATNPTQEPEVLDWNPSRTAPLENETFILLTEYDALGRMTTLYNWHRDITFAANGTQTVTAGTTNRVAVYVPKYNERGALKTEWLHVRATKNTVNEKITFAKSATPAHNTQAIKEITRNVKGQKQQLKLDNGTITTYTYDDKNFRLRSLHTVRTTGLTGSMQNLSYTYDPVGNITHINDTAQATVFANNSIIRPEHHYIYDALYRLIDATGRENPSPPPSPKSSEGPWPQGLIPTPDVPRNYTQRYRYDEVGNFLEMQHYSPDSTSRWTRHYTVQPDSNRLHQTWYGNHTDKAVTYHHDHHGSMLNLNRVATPPALDPEEEWGLAIQWDWRDMIRGFDCIGGGLARYHYGIDKQRTRKHITRNTTAGGTITEDRIYLGGYELYRRRNPQGAVVEEIESLHLFEGEQRVLLVDDVIVTNKTHDDRTAYKTGPIYRYQYGNHLGSACLELDHEAEIISYEEYHPYGASAYRVIKSGVEAPTKRYRYTGMERDGESGLSYHGARYYAPWLGRWASADPVGIEGGLNCYCYCNGNPVGFEDPNGLQSASASMSKEVRDRGLAFAGGIYGAGKSLLGGFSAAAKIGYYSMGSNMYFFTDDDTYREQDIEFRKGYAALNTLLNADIGEIAKGYIVASGNAVTEASDRGDVFGASAAAGETLMDLFLLADGARSSTPRLKISLEPGQSFVGGLTTAGGISISVLGPKNLPQGIYVMASTGEKLSSQQEDAPTTNEAASKDPSNIKDDAGTIKGVDRYGGGQTIMLAKLKLMVGNVTETLKVAMPNSPKKGGSGWRPEQENMARELGYEPLKPATPGSGLHAEENMAEYLQRAGATVQEWAIARGKGGSSFLCKSQGCRYYAASWPEPVK